MTFGAGLVVSTGLRPQSPASTGGRPCNDMFALIPQWCFCGRLFVVSVAPEQERDTAAELFDRVASGLDAERATGSRDGSFRCSRCGSFNSPGADAAVRVLTTLVERAKAPSLYGPGAN